MLVVDQFISEKILQISKHFNQNISTRFLRPIFVGIFSDTNLMHSISELTEHTSDFFMQGQDLGDLYSQIFAMAEFIFLVRRDILPNLHNLASLNTSSAGSDKVYRKMAFSSLPMNIELLATMLSDLYEATLKYDIEHSRRTKAMVKQFPQAEGFYRMIGRENFQK